MAEQAVPYWRASAAFPEYPMLDTDLTVDVTIVGAGITGLTAAYLLKRAGRTVAVVERDQVGGVDTMRTTAHVTAVTDLNLTELDKNFGRDHAQATWDAGYAAIQQIDTIVREEGISCDWARVPGYKHLPTDTPVDRLAQAIAHLREEAALAFDLGFNARSVDEVPAMSRPGVVFEDQARIHPGKYLARLARLVNGGGSFIFERTAYDEITEDPLAVTARGFTISCGYVILATHTPLIGKATFAATSLLQTKLYPHTSYVIGGPLPKHSAPDALFWDTADPYRYARVTPYGDQDFLIYGGEDHKTGQAGDPEARFLRLEAAATRLFPALQLTHRWLGQVIETNDGLPFMGETAERQFVATGFAGNGTTFGTLAAMMARDSVLGLTNPWRELFDSSRTKIKGGAWDYVKENLDYPYYMLRDRLRRADGSSLDALLPGQGKILSLDGQKVAAVRRNDGTLTLLSPVCTHLGCLVAWNDAEGTWDCPCHGSRFTADGHVLSGPAESALEPWGR